MPGRGPEFEYIGKFSFYRPCEDGSIGAAKGKLIRDIGVTEVYTTPSFPVNGQEERGVRLEGDCTQGQVVEIAKMLAAEHILKNSEGRRVQIRRPEAPQREPAVVVRR